MRKLAQITLLSLVFGCSAPDFSKIQREGETQIKKLTAELSQIETKEDLQRAAPTLKKRFNQIASILLQIRKYSPSDGQRNVPASLASEQLFLELARLYEMPGGKELIEGAQLEAVQKLRSALPQ